MNSIALFAVVLAVAGGFIAWLGDRLGTKIGKKRYTLFGKLRPRHTATVSTIFAGVVISLLTLSVLIASNYAFKRALLEGPRLVFQNDELRTQNKSLAANSKVYEDQTNGMARRLNDAQRKFDEAQKKLAPVQQQLKNSQHQLADTRAALGATTQQLNDAKQKVASAQQKVASAQQKVASAQRQVSGVQRQVRTLQATRGHLIALNQGLVNYANGLRNTSSFGVLMYHQDEEVGRAVITTGQPARAVQAELSRFLHDLGREAVRRGGTKSGAVVLALPSQTREAQAIKALSQNITEEAGKVRSVVVIARVKGNTFQGEAVAVDLKPYDNVFIYRKGAVVASQVIDGTQSPLQILSALKKFFVLNVRPAALSHGLIPQTDPVTGEPVFGTIDENTTFRLGNKIQQIGANAQVTAYARVNTYSSGPIPLLLDLDVTQAPSSQAHSTSAQVGGSPP